jgi:hypothetical protein
MKEIEDLLAAVRARYVFLMVDEDARARMASHLRNLSRMDDEPMDYRAPDSVEFPSQMTIAYAVCHPDCGRVEFIVDGSTQECQRCGGLMYRCASKHYTREGEGVVVG